MSLSRQECRSLIGAISKPYYRLCCSAMYTLGLRLKDAITLPVSAIDSEQMIVRIISKRNKERIVPLPESLLLELRSFWTTHRHPIWIFPNLAGTGHMCRKSLYRAFNSARDSLGLGSRVTTHCLRHSFATHLIESGVDIHTLQILLGHTSIRTTQIYTHLTQAIGGELQKHVDGLFGDLFAGGSCRDK